MKLSFIPFTLLLFVTSITIAQKDLYSCSALKNKKITNKSNTLSVAQIAQTERYDVTFYHLDLNMSNTSTSVDGTVEIQGFAKENLDSVWFELFQTFTISEIRFNGNPTVYNRTASAIKVPVNLNLGETFSIEIDYNGLPPSGATNPLGGSGMTNDFSPSWGNQVTWSLSEPFSAFEWFPCKQSLTDKADSVYFDITVPSALKAGSNGILEQELDLGNGFTKFMWRHRKPISYYLISVAVAEYVDYTIYANPLGSLNPIPIVNYVYNNPQTLPNFQADIDETVDFIEYFSEIFGLYPFHEEKYGHCMAPLSGGMEHQTMTTQGYFEKTLTAHELGHQWWGNNVTCSSWADIWVNEGFASYSEYLMLAQLYPGEEVTDMLQRHSNIKSQGGGSVWVEDSLNDGRIFSSRLTYDKGAAIVHTFRYILNNDEQFFSALRTFQNDFALSNASALDVKNALETTSGLDLTEAFEQWYFGEGFPTYSAKWNVVNNELYVQVSHAASAAGITPLFTNPLDLKFQRTGLSDTTIRFDIQSNTQLFILEDLGNVSNLSAIDPKNWIINNNGLIQHDLNLGISSVENLVEYKNEIIVSPNPSADFIEIKSLENKEFSLKIIDQKGAVCFLGKVKANHKIDVSKLKSGSYMMQIEDIDGSKITRKIVRK